MFFVVGLRVFKVVVLGIYSGSGVFFCQRKRNGNETKTKTKRKQNGNAP